MIGEILNGKYEIYSGFEVEQRKKKDKKYRFPLF
jgi:hypothetical protein